jgi:hypothetical protein
MTVLGWWTSNIPASVRSFVISSALGLQSTTVAAIAVGYALGLCGTFGATMHFLATAWWGICLGTFFGVGPYYRARQGAVAAANTVQLPDGATAVVTPAAKTIVVAKENPV